MFSTSQDTEKQADRRSSTTWRAFREVYSPRCASEQRAHPTGEWLTLLVVKEAEKGQIFPYFNGQSRAANHEEQPLPSHHPISLIKSQPCSALPNEATMRHHRPLPPLFRGAGDELDRMFSESLPFRIGQSTTSALVTFFHHQPQL